MPPDWPQLLLACIADDVSGAKTLAEFYEHRARRTELAKVIGLYAQSKSWRRVRLSGGSSVGPGENQWTDFLFQVAYAEAMGDALLALDCP